MCSSSTRKSSSGTYQERPWLQRSRNQQPFQNTGEPVLQGQVRLHNEYILSRHTYSTSSNIMAHFYLWRNQRVGFLTVFKLCVGWLIDPFVHNFTIFTILSLGVWRIFIYEEISKRDVFPVFKLRVGWLIDPFVDNFTILSLVVWRIFIYEEISKRDVF
jgi:hypothetical protein